MIKSFKRLVKQILLDKVQSQLNPVHYLYWTDAIILFNCEHLEGTETHARLLFIAVSSYFSIVQPHILMNHKLFNLEARSVNKFLLIIILYFTYCSGATHCLTICCCFCFIPVTVIKNKSKRNYFTAKFMPINFTETDT